DGSGGTSGSGGTGGQGGIDGGSGSGGAGGVAGSGGVAGQEAACGALGAKCVCARTLRTTGTWLEVPGWPGVLYESDQDATDPKLCGTIIRGTDGIDRVTVTNQGESPSVVDGPNGLTGVYQMNITNGTFYVEVYDNNTGRFQMQNRVGMRYYSVNNPDYVT